MKKRGLVILSIAGVMVIAFITFVAINWNNVQAIRYYLFFTEDNIADSLRQNEEAITAAMDKVPSITLRDLTDEERRLLERGDLSQEDAIQLILGATDTGTGNAHATGGNDPITGTSNATGASDPGTGNGTGGNGNGTGSGGTGTGSDSGTSTGAGGSESGTNISTTQNTDKDMEVLSGLLAEIYVLKATFINKLEALKDEAITEYHALDPAERTDANKQKLGMAYVKKAGDLESECDKKMDSLLKKIEAELKRINGDLSLVSDIKKAYANEKSLRKAEYLAAYK